MEIMIKNHEWYAYDTHHVYSKSPIKMIVRFWNTHKIIQIIQALCEKKMVRSTTKVPYFVSGQWAVEPTSSWLVSVSAKLSVEIFATATWFRVPANVIQIAWFNWLWINQKRWLIGDFKRRKKCYLVGFRSDLTICFCWFVRGINYRIL